ncbi:hypothetical protein A7X67_02960 [Clostridium sp. W14A]|nr:hypothetical protein A7X67_02960 [Clostridium sp. W14A]
MNIYYSSLNQIGIPVQESLKNIIQSGGTAVELLLDGAEWNEFNLRTREFARLLSGLPLQYSVHTPVWDINLTSENAQARQAAIDAYRSSIVFAAAVHAEHVVIHPGFCYASVFRKETARKRAAQAIEELCRFNAPYRVPLLVENVGTAKTSIFTQEEYIGFIEGFGGRIGSLLDVGHAHLCGWDLPQTIGRLNPYLFAVHFHDNNGDEDFHLPIGEGSIPWPSVYRSLRECRPELRLVLEYEIGTPMKKLMEGSALLARAFPNEFGLPRPASGFGS